MAASKRTRRKIKDRQLVDLIEAFFIMGIGLDLIREVQGGDELLWNARATQMSNLSELLEIYESRNPGYARVYLESLTRKFTSRKAESDGESKDPGDHG